MRVEFCQAILETAARDPRFFFVTGDLGYNALEKLRELKPDRFLNAGVAEQNMVGLTAGLALTGLRPWIYSIIPFTTFRCLEQLRNDVGLHDLPVRVVGNGGGYTYGIMGSTHHALEDLGVLKALPNFTLFFPQTGDQVAAAARVMEDLPGPAYLRLGISAFTAKAAPDWENPVTLTRRYGANPAAAVTVIGAGQAAQLALAARAAGDPAWDRAELFGLARHPFDLAADAPLRESMARTRRVVFVEEHYAAGGMGESLLGALAARRSLPSEFRVLAPAYAKDQRYGSARFHLEQAGVTPARLTALLQETLTA